MRHAGALLYYRSSTTDAARQHPPQSIIHRRCCPEITPNLRSPCAMADIGRAPQFG